MADPLSTLPAFLDSQQLAQGLLRDLVPHLEAGMSEQDVHRLALERGRALGVHTWFRPPAVRFGGPPALRPTDRPRRSPALAPGMLVELEVAPATDQAFGHAGVALAFQQADPPVVEGARELCRAVVGFASRWKCVGELFVFAQAWANNRRASLGGQTSIGFLALTPDRAWAGRWPQGAWAHSLLRRNQIQYFNPRRMNGVYVVRPRLVMDGQGASFAELVLVTPEDKRILGREGLDQVGRL